MGCLKGRARLYVEIEGGSDLGGLDFEGVCVGGVLCLVWQTVLCQSTF